MNLNSNPWLRDGLATTDVLYGITRFYEYFEGGLHKNTIVTSLGEMSYVVNTGLNTRCMDIIKHCCVAGFIAGECNASLVRNEFIRV